MQNMRTNKTTLNNCDKTTKPNTTNLLVHRNITFTYYAHQNGIETKKTIRKHIHKGKEKESERAMEREKERY